MSRLLIVVPMLALLGACTSQQEITKPPVAYKGIKQLPAQTYRGDAETTIRTSAKTKDGRSELTGANCTLTTPYTESQFQTPARVLTPNLGPATPTANLKCSTGDRFAQKNLNAVNLTLAERSARARASGAGGGIIGAIASGVMAGINEGKGDQPGDVHGYAPTNLDMNATVTPSSN